MMFCKIIRKIVCAFLSVDDELPLLDPVVDPEETHVGGFGTLLFDGFVINYGNACAVSLDGCGRLGVSHFYEWCAQWDGVALRSGMVLRALWKGVATSASVVDAMMLCNMLLMVCVAPLYGGGVAVGEGAVEGLAGLEPRKK
jgi:hypothetical protein